MGSIGKNVPANLARLLRDRGLLGKDFAKALNVSTATVSHWLTGKSLPETWRFDDIARVLKTDFIELVRDPEIPLEQELTVGFLREMATRLGHELKKKP